MNTAKDSSLKAAADNTTVALWRADAILAALGGSAEGWDYFGEVNDLGRVAGECACGHPIRYEFLLRKEGRVAILGSECINHFHEFSPELVARCNADLARLENLRKEAERRAKELKEEEAVAAALAAFEPIYNEAKELLTARRSLFVCPEVYGLRLPAWESVGAANFWGVKTRKTLLPRIARLRSECEAAIAANKLTPPRKFARDVEREQVSQTLKTIEPLLEVLRRKARESYGSFVSDMRDKLETGASPLIDLPRRAYDILGDIWAKETSGARSGSKAFTVARVVFEDMAAAQWVEVCKIRGNENLAAIGLPVEKIEQVEEERRVAVQVASARRSPMRISRAAKL